MITLNLTDLEKSEIKYKISNFPDGQNQVTIELPNKWDIASQGETIIKSRLNNFKDLELIICATKSLRGLGVKDISLYTPYFLGSRSDRKFEEGGNNYLKDIICPIINSLNFSNVVVWDPHSSLLEACINNFKIDNIGNFYDSCYKDINSKNITLVCPDAGAQKRVELAAKYMRINDIIVCSKERDNEGKLTKCVVPNIIKECGKDLVIVDDCADGGGTFINIAKYIKETRNVSSMVHPSQYGKIYLIVTHGIFSKGFGELQQYFDGIYTTNSYKNLQMEPFVKQFNVF